MSTYIAGFGINSVLGNSNKEIFENLSNSKICYKYYDERNKLGYQSSLFAKVENKQYLKTKERLPKSLQNIAAVIQNCIDDSFPFNFNKNKCGGIIVSTDSNVENLLLMFEQYNKFKSTKAISIQHSFDTLNSNISLLLANEFNINTLNLTISSACSGGGNAVGIANLYIDSGLLDYCFVVGYQEDNDYAQLSFDSTRLFSKNICRPFDKNRDGIVPSSGCGCLLLTNDIAYNKYGEIFDYGISTGSDKINPSYDSIYKCIKSACKKIKPIDDLIYINAHATGTKIGDSTELNAIYNLIGDYPNIVTSTKALTGHECWTSGINEIIYSLIQVYNGVIFKQANYEDSEIDLILSKKNIITEDKYIKLIRDKFILSNNFGFGGSNSSILIKLK